MRSFGNEIMAGLRHLLSVSCIQKFQKLGTTSVFSRSSLVIQQTSVPDILSSKLHTSPINMSKTAMLLLSEGAEEIETVVTIDVLRRAGINVTVAGVDSMPNVKCAHGTTLVADKSLDEASKSTYDVIIMPGGLKGSQTMAASPQVGQLLKGQESAGRHVAAICAAPMALASHGVFKGKNVTIYPSMEDKMAGYSCKEDRVVVDGTCITSRGPGTTFDFALTIVECLLGKDAAKKTADPMLFKWN